MLRQTPIILHSITYYYPQYIFYHKYRLDPRKKNYKKRTNKHIKPTNLNEHHHCSHDFPLTDFQDHCRGHRDDSAEAERHRCGAGHLDVWAAQRAFRGATV